MTSGHSFFLNSVSLSVFRFFLGFIANFSNVVFFPNFLSSLPSYATEANNWYETNTAENKTIVAATVRSTATAALVASTAFSPIPVKES